MSWNQQSPSYLTGEALAARVSAFLGRVYAWMFLGLLVTAGPGVLQVIKHLVPVMAEAGK